MCPTTSVGRRACLLGRTGSPEMRTRPVRTGRCSCFTAGHIAVMRSPLLHRRALTFPSHPLYSLDGVGFCRRASWRVCAGQCEAGGRGHNVIIARAHSLSGFFVFQPSCSRAPAPGDRAVAKSLLRRGWCLPFKTVEGKRDISHPKHDGKPIERHVVYAVHLMPSKIRRYWQLGGPHVSCRMPLDGFAVFVVAVRSIVFQRYGSLVLP